MLLQGHNCAYSPERCYTAILFRSTKKHDKQEGEPEERGRSRSKDKEMKKDIKT